MTPFDPVACLAMLLAFYPIVGPAALARARAERPEYFAGAVPIGSSGDKMQLPDGRILDFIFAVLSPDQRWQVLDVSGPGGPGAALDPFALEDGPLRPIDESAWPTPAPAAFFEPLVAGHLAGLGDAGGVLDRAHGRLTEAAAPGDLDALMGGDIGTAAGVLDQQLGAAYAFVPDAELNASHGQAGQTGVHEANYVEPMPPDFPAVDEPFPDTGEPDTQQP